MRRLTNNLSDTGVWLLLALLISLPVGWFTHVITCLQQSEWFFLIAGAICFPIAWIHGLGILLGVF